MHLWKFLYYACAIDNTMMHALKDLTLQLNTATATTTTHDIVKYFINNCATKPDAIITYWASDIILQADHDAACLAAPKFYSCANGYIFLGNANKTTKIIDNNMNGCWVGRGS